MLLWPGEISSGPDSGCATGPVAFGSEEVSGPPPHPCGSKYNCCLYVLLKLENLVDLVMC